MSNIHPTAVIEDGAQIAASAKTAQMHVDACDRAKRTQEEA